MGSTTHVKQTDVVQYSLSWSGGQATNGDITVEADNGDGIWFPLDFGATVSLDGVSGSHQLVVTQVSFVNMRLSYSRTNVGATGALNATVFASTKGA